MENEHGAYFDFDFMLAACMMDEDEKIAVRSVIEAKSGEEEAYVADTNINIKSEPQDELLLVEEGKNRGVKRINSVDIKDEPLEKQICLEKTSPRKPEELASEVNNKSINKKFDCTQCGASFEKEENLKIHTKIVHTTDKKSRFYCTECDTSYTRKDSLRIHKKNKHTSPASIDEKPKDETMVAPSVPKFLAMQWSKKELESEPIKEESPIAETMNGSERSLTCVPCNTTFAQRASLNRHTKNVHIGGETLFSCDLCDATFTRKDNLKKHNNNRHPEHFNVKIAEVIADVITNRTTESSAENMDSKGEVDKKNSHKKVRRNSNMTKDANHADNEKKNEMVVKSTEKNDQTSSNEAVQDSSVSSSEVKETKLSQPEVSVPESQTKVKSGNRSYGSRNSSKPKFITNYPCDKCDKVFSMRETILEHVKIVHGIIVPGLNDKDELKKKTEEVADDKTEKVKVQNHDEKSLLKTNAMAVDDANRSETEASYQNNNLETESTDPLLTENDQQDSGNVPNIEIEHSNSEVDPLMESIAVDEENNFPESIGTESSVEDPDDPDPIGEDDLEEDIDDPMPIEQQDDENLVNENFDTDNPEISSSVDGDTSEETKPYIQVDLSSSKFFRSNTYTICSLDLYSSGCEEDFEECFDLPEGWRYKTFGLGSESHFLAPDKRVIKSRLGAIEYMRLNGSYTRQELWEYSTYLKVPDEDFENLFL